MGKLTAIRRKALPAVRNVPERVADKAPVVKTDATAKPVRTGLINRT